MQVNNLHIFLSYYIIIYKFSSMRNKNIQTLRGTALILTIVNRVDKPFLDFLLALLLFLIIESQQ
ncbi:hypothetical protein DPY74_01255 [Salmonella enterica subsp. salamae]|nr:hypothetical protein DOE60_06740 [Salmonella enterica subsp. salamae serovar 56:z10:e,n,x]ECE6397027.1 hypothetical protein [Salmonella enterica subsp. salamae]